MAEPKINLNTPMMEQFLSIKEKTDAILFFRMGDFYEMFLDDAKIASEILEITLTKRNGVPMCGIPYHAKDSYLYKLIKSGKRVAICEQVEDPKKTKKIVKREIVEIVTPGTLIDNKILEANNPNYIASFIITDNKVSISYCDVSTGEMYFVSETFDNNKIKCFELLRDELYRVRPKEIIFPETFIDNPFINDLKTENQSAIYYPVSDFYFNYDYAKKILKNELSVSSLKGFGIKEKSEDAGVLGAIIKYIKDVQMKDIGHIKSITKISRKDFMELSATAIQNLELLNNLYDGSQKHSLFHVLNDCRTSMGSRQLFEWIKRPLINVDEIKKRHDVVEYFYLNLDILANLRSMLKEINDIERLNTRVYFSKSIPRDVVALSASIKKSREIKEYLINSSEENFEEIKGILDNIKNLKDLTDKIDNTVNDDPPSSFDEGGVIKPGFNKKLDEYKKISKEGRNYIINLQEREAKATGISSLKVKYNKVIGYFIEVSKSNVKNVPDHYIKKQELVGNNRYTLPELEEYETKILEAKDKISTLEEKIFEELCVDIINNYDDIKSIATSIKKLDVLSSFAFSSSEKNYSRPVINSSFDLKLEEARHPVIEAFFKENEFIPNDVEMNSDDKKLLLITGPNMSGKSTYLRQTALNVIIAQIGCFIPASKGEIGIVDKIFTRIGASDFLVKGQSTFLVEMTEAAEILNNASERSLIIMDEIGRGTSTYDGLSIAWAIVEYLTSEDKIRGKTLFATHYHELTGLAKERGIQNYQVSVKEWDDKILFLHKVIKGAASKSYGIQVAKLAGIPKDVTDRAINILQELEKNIDGLEASTLIEDRLKEEYTKEQLSLFSSDYDKLTSELTSLNLEKFTPLEALNYLNDLIERIKHNKI